MNYEAIINNSIEYTKETFAGYWDRWIILALLGVPFTLIRFLIDPEKIVTAAGIMWEQIPWGSIGALVIAGILTSFFIAGYTVRIYRGTWPPPGLTGWASLFIDGIRLDIVILVWFLPVIILALLFLFILLGGLFSHGTFPDFSPLVLILSVGLIFLVGMVLLFIASLYVTMGAIRFARTGSMAEGWRFSAISALIRRIGWWNYFIAIVLIGIAALVYSIAMFLPASIPYVGWIVPVGLAPFFTVFVARYYTLVYETGEERPAAPPAPPGPSGA